MNSKNRDSHLLFSISGRTMEISGLKKMVSDTRNKLNTQKKKHYFVFLLMLFLFIYPLDDWHATKLFICSRLLVKKQYHIFSNLDALLNGDLVTKFD